MAQTCVSSGFDKPKQAVILAAGLGTRLRPVTYYLPKPLFPVLNTPILTQILHGFIGAGFSRVLVNVYHLSELLTDFLRVEQFPNVNWVIEKTLMGTGGALRNFLPYLNSNAPVMVYNSDILSNIDLDSLYRLHSGRGVGVTMLMHRRDGSNNVLCQNDRIVAFRVADKNAWTYTGIMVIEPGVIARYFPEEPSDMINCLQNAMEDGVEVQAVYPEDVGHVGGRFLWEDIGTVRGYLTAHALLLHEKGTPFLLDEVRHSDQRLILRDWVCIGKDAMLSDDTVICRSVIWPNTDASHCKEIVDRIVTPWGTLALS